MKKIIVSLASIAIMALVCVSFTACSSDNDGDGGSGGGSIVGTWYMASIFYQYSDGTTEKEEINTAETSWYMEYVFKEDKTYERWQAITNWDSKLGKAIWDMRIELSGTYTLKGNTLTRYGSDGDVADVVTLKWSNNNEFKIRKDKKSGYSEEVWKRGSLRK